MATLLTLLICAAIGWALKRRYGRVAWRLDWSPQPRPLSEELEWHYEAHAKAQEGSIVMHAPEALRLRP